MKTPVSLPPPIFAGQAINAQGKGLAEIQTAFSEALTHHQQGRLPEAEAGYRQVLSREQGHADAWQLLGLVAHQAGRHELAIDLIARAIKLNKNVITYHANLAVVLKALGRREDALATYADLAQLDPRSPDIHFNRGLLFAELGRFAEAVACYRQAIALRADHAPSHAKLGIGLSAQQLFQEAVAAYDKALVLQPQAYDIHYNRAIALWQLNDLEGAAAGYRAVLALKPDLVEAQLRIGNILKQQERFDEAATAYRDLIERVPAYAEAHCNLGLVLFAQGDLDAAEQAYRRAIGEKPALCEAHINLGNVCREREQHEEAIACYRIAMGLEPGNLQVQCNFAGVLLAQERLTEALEVIDAVLARDPGFAEAHYNRGIALTALRDLNASVAAYDRAIALKPDYAQAHYNSSYPRLLLGDLQRGFASYQWRLRGGSKEHVSRYADYPMLADTNIAGRIILLHAEQGLGDTIQFCRYAKLVQAAGGRVVLEAPRHLHRLLSRLEGISALHVRGEAPPPFDFHCPLMSLPALFGTTVETIPATPAYLFAEEEACVRWRERLGSHGFKIGIAWQGNPNATAEKGRSAPLAAFAPLAAIPGVRLISLQKTHGLDQLQTLPPGMQVETLGEDFDSGPDAFIDTAGVMMNLDLIVTVDTSIGHLAGALGRPTWTALQKIPHWVWMLEGTDSPWYPSVRLFRQSVRGDWNGPFQDMARQIGSKSASNLPERLYSADAAEPPEIEAETAAVFARALALHQQSRFSEAETLYRAVLAREPAHGDALHLLGLLAHQAGKNEDAAGLIRTAIEVKPDVAIYYTNLAVVLKALARRDEAVVSYQAAARLDSVSADIRFNLGLLLEDLGRFAEAEVAHRDAIALRADFAAAHVHLGMVLNGLARPAEAVASYDRALALQPSNATTHYNRALALWQTGELDAAVSGYRIAVTLKPNFAEAHLRIGNVLKQQKKWNGAEEAYRLALAVRPGYAEARSNLGMVYYAQDRLDDAMAAYRAALASDPRLCEAHLNLGNVLLELGALHEAMLAYEAGIRIEPQNAKANFNLAHPLLLLGDYARGLHAYEWRLRGEDLKFVRRFPGKPLLADRNVAGKTILLQGEQGLGDTIQFSRYASHLAAAGARIVLELPRHMQRLFARLPDVAAMYAPGTPVPEFDAHLPLMSLPALLGTTAGTIPSSPAYLFAEPQAIAKWRERLGGHGFKIGIAWQGNPDASAEKGRSAPLAAFAPLAAIPGVRLISLQMRHGLEQLQALPVGMAVETLGEDFDSGPDAFIDTAGVMMNLDLIVTVDTSIGHLAGALGCPTWIALQKIPHWVWMLEGTGSPWYPSVRLFRQSVRGDWSGPFAAMAQEIQHRKG